MRLSEAIRLGAMLRPQVFGLMSGNGGTCAMGAACEAGGIATTDMDTWELPPAAHWLMDSWNASVPPSQVIQCPECAAYGSTLCFMVTHLNDTHRWTREQTADWVATVEPAETTSAAHQPVDVRGTTDVDQPVLSLREV